MNFRSGVSSCSSRSIEAVVWINEIETAKSEDVVFSHEAKLQKNFEVLDSDIAAILKKIINGDFKRRVFV